MDKIADAVWLWKTKDDETALRKILLPIETLVDDLPEIVVKDATVGALAHGATLARPGVVKIDKGITKGNIVRIMTLKGEVVALAEMFVDSSEIEEMTNGEIAKSQSVLMEVDIYPRAWKTE